MTASTKYRLRPEPVARAVITPRFDLREEWFASATVADTANAAVLISSDRARMLTNLIISETVLGTETGCKAVTQFPRDILTAKGIPGTERYDESACPPAEYDRRQHAPGEVDKVLYVGVDAHQKTTHITVMDDTGKILRRKRVSSSPEGLREALGDYEDPIKAVVEATYNWGPVYDWLSEITDEVVLAHPTKVRAIADARIKTDTIDSRTLAHLLRADLIPAAYAPSKETRAVKRVLRQRMFFVRLQTMLKNRVHALLSQHAVALPEVTDLYGKVGLAWLRALPLPGLDGRLLHDDLDLLETLWEHIAATDSLMVELAAGDNAITWLASLPGIGPFFSVLIRYEVDDITRFRDAKKFVAYTGLIPSTYASGTRVFHGRLTKQGNRWLRWAFIEAVAPALRASAPLRKYYDQIKARRGAKDARVATARKLAELAWSVWTERRCYVAR